jgi:23S rRNA pseudouridine1911/1915/1917 synthase
MAEVLTVPPEAAGERLDVFLAAHAGSRAAAQRLIDGGGVTVDGEPRPKRHVLVGGETVAVAEVATGAEPREVPPASFSVAYEDEHLLIVDKPPGVVVHPARGHRRGTLVQALAGRVAGGDDPERPGVVHRLDRDTSGLMVLAKGEPAYSRLVRMMSARRVGRVYRAIVEGVGLPRTGTIDSPVGRDPDNPTLMAAGVGKPAVTQFEVLATAADHSMLRVRLQTGRTHQIRVHLSAIGYPVYADPMYGNQVPGHRLWLHAEQLSFEHPVAGEALEFHSDIPEDLRDSAAGLDGSLALW